MFLDIDAHRVRGDPKKSHQAALDYRMHFLDTGFDFAGFVHPEKIGEAMHKMVPGDFLRIPDDVTITTFDDVGHPTAELTFPGTTVSADTHWYSFDVPSNSFRGVIEHTSHRVARYSGNSFLPTVETGRNTYGERLTPLSFTDGKFWDCVEGLSRFPRFTIADITKDALRDEWSGRMWVNEDLIWAGRSNHSHHFLTLAVPYAQGQMFHEVLYRTLHDPFQNVLSVNVELSPDQQELIRPNCSGHDLEFLTLQIRRGTRNPLFLMEDIASMDYDMTTAMARFI